MGFRGRKKKERERENERERERESPQLGKLTFNKQNLL